MGPASHLFSPLLAAGGLSELRIDLLPKSWPTLLLLAGLVGALLLWLALHALSRRALKPETSPWFHRLPLFILRVASATFLFWMFWQCMSRFLYLATDWPLWIAALVGGLASEIAISLYRSQRRDMKQSMSRLVLALRLLAIGLVMWVLVEPVLALLDENKIEKTIAVLVDDSGSMHVNDDSYTIPQKLDIAELFRVDGIANRPKFRRTLKAVQEVTKNLRAELPSLDANPKDAEKRVREIVSTSSPDFQDADRGILSAARGEIEASSYTPEQLPVIVANALNQLDFRLRDLPRLSDSRDEAFYNSLSDEQRRAIDAASLRPRADIARATLRQMSDGEPLLQRLADTYELTFARFGQSVEDRDVTAYTKPSLRQVDPRRPNEENNPVGPEYTFQSQTDLGAALEQPLGNVASGTLGGVLVLTDGRHNVGPFPDRVARRYGIQNAPIHTIMIGTEKGIEDAAIVYVDAPESVFLGDRMTMQADLKVAGMKGQQVKMVFKHEDQILENRIIPINTDLLRTSINFSHTPTEEGVHQYEIEMEPMPGEKYTDNNKWVTEIAVSDDRTNLLIVDGSPRWEFRYLRNLFYGRDRGVHLQHVLLNPDKVMGQRDPPPIFASAARDFGRAEATRLPETPVEWRKFDIIVLGDIADQEIDDQTWKTIYGCVKERGALLIIIAGPNHMPHAITSKELQELLPVRVDFTRYPLTTSPETAFRMEPTAAGLDHTILRQSDDPLRTRAIWKSLPPMYWRHPVRSTKPGATVLAWAREVDPIQGTELSRLPKSNVERRKLAEQNPLLATHTVGAGRVAWLGTDRTWRLRYRVGDVFHHRFWGQFMRWGSGDTLRAGNEFVRLGTDQLVYSQEEDIKVRARLSDRERNPLKAETVHAELFKSDRQVSRVKLEFQPDSNGLYEGTVPGIEEPGRYRVVLNTPLADQPVETTLTVVATKTPVELAEIAADPSGMARLASMTGGSLIDPLEADRIFDLLGDPNESQAERTDITLWDNIPVFLLFLALLCAEWITRRMRGFA